MAFVTLADADIAVGAPIDQALMQQIKDNFDALNTAVASAIEGIVPNGSFEVDSDSDGNPDNWTIGLYTGGSKTYGTTTPAHGAKAIAFTTPGGTGNGGGYAMSDYIPVSEYCPGTLRFLHKASVAGMTNQVTVYWYTAAKAACGTASTVLYSSAANPTAWTEFIYGVTPPSTARFCRIVVVGGVTNSVAGTAYFDKVEFESKERDCFVGMATGMGTGGNTNLTIAGSAVATPLLCGDGASPISVVSGGKVDVAGGTTVAIVFGGTLSLSLPAGLWTIYANATTTPGDETKNYRISAVAIRQA